MNFSVLKKIGEGPWSSFSDAMHKEIQKSVYLGGHQMPMHAQHRNYVDGPNFPNTSLQNVTFPQHAKLIWTSEFKFLLLCILTIVKIYI